MIKNRLFQPIGVMLGDGTMLHLQSREEREVSLADLDAPHFKAMLASGELAVRDLEVQASAAAAPQQSSSAPESPAPAEPEPRPHKGRRGILGRRQDDQTE
jgi:hypothetical protein